MKLSSPFLYIRNVFLVFGLLSLHITLGQVKVDTLLASKYYSQADSLLSKRKYAASLKIFEQALPLYEKAKTWSKVASCYNKLSHNKWRLGNIKASKKDAETALQIISTHQIKNTDDEAYAYNNIAFYYQEISDFDKTIAYRQKALRVRQRIFPENHIMVAQSYGYLASVYDKIAAYDKAIEFYEKELNIYKKLLDPSHHKIGTTYFNLGGIYSSLDLHKKALEYYKIFSEITTKNYGPDHLYIGYSHINMGIVYVDIRQYDKGLQHYQKALSILKRKKNQYGLNMLYKNLGHLMYENKEYDKALQYFQKCLQIGLEIYEENHPEIGDNYANISSVMVQINDYENALIYHQKALHVFKTIYGENHDRIALQYRTFAAIYSLKKEYDKALTFLTKSLDITKNIFGENHPKTVKSYEPLGQHYLGIEAYDEALHYFTKCLEIYKTEYGDLDLRTSKFQNYVASVYHKQHKFEEAISHYNKAIIANTKNEKAVTNKDIFVSNQYSNLEIALTSFAGKAKVLQSRYDQNKQKQDLLESVAIYNKIPSIIDKKRLSHRNYKDKLSLVQLGKEIYTDAIASQLLMYKDSQQQENIEKAWLYVEKSKAGVLKELLTDVQAKGGAGLPTRLLEIEKNLKTDNAYYQSKILEEQANIKIDTSKIKRYQSELFDINRKQDSLLFVFENDYPKYYNLKHSNAILPLSDIQKKLPQQTTMLEFFVSDSTAYVFAISNNTIATKKLTIPKLHQNIENFRKSIISMDTHAFTSISNTLYQQLIAPL